VARSVNLVAQRAQCFSSFFIILQISFYSRDETLFEASIQPPSGVSPEGVQEADRNGLSSHNPDCSKVHQSSNEKRLYFKDIAIHHSLDTYGCTQGQRSGQNLLTRAI
jgi:hypothetical protein